MKKFILIACSVCALGAQRLSLNEYLKQAEKDEDYQAAQVAEVGAEKKVNEADMVLSPFLFASYEHSRDKNLAYLYSALYVSPTVNPSLYAFSFDKTETDDVFTAGVKKDFSFGLSSKLYYTVIKANAKYMTYDSTTYYAEPKLELTQNLWRNAFGAETRAKVEGARARNEATMYGERYHRKLLKYKAELTYWRVVVAREVIKTQRDLLDRAKKLFSWASRRASLNLGDKSDRLGAEALVNLRQLELQAAVVEERSAISEFNLIRNRSKEDKVEELEDIGVIEVGKFKNIDPIEKREDLLSAIRQRDAEVAKAEIDINSYRPTFDLVASGGIHGRDSTGGEAIDNSFKTNNKEYSVGVNFVAPLDVFSLNKALDGYQKDKIIADHHFQRKAREVEDEWRNLQKDFEDAKLRLKFAVALEEAQKSKLEFERNKLNKGRTTTYQVLTYEQDFSQAELQKIKTIFDVVKYYAQLKLFGSES